MSNDPRQHTNDVLGALENGLIDKDYLITALLNALSDSEVHQAMLANDILVDDLDEDDFEDWGSIGPPS